MKSYGFFVDPFIFFFQSGQKKESSEKQKRQKKGKRFEKCFHRPIPFKVQNIQNICSVSCSRGVFGKVSKRTGHFQEPAPMGAETPRKTEKHPASNSIATKIGGLFKGRAFSCLQLFFCLLEQQPGVGIRCRFHHQVKSPPFVCTQAHKAPSFSPTHALSEGRKVL